MMSIERRIELCLKLHVNATAVSKTEQLHEKVLMRQWGKSIFAPKDPRITNKVGNSCESHLTCIRYVSIDLQ